MRAVAHTLTPDPDSGREFAVNAALIPGEHPRVLLTRPGHQRGVSGSAGDRFELLMVAQRLCGLG